MRILRFSPVSRIAITLGCYSVVPAVSSLCLFQGFGRKVLFFNSGQSSPGFIADRWMTKRNIERTSCHQLFSSSSPSENTVVENTIMPGPELPPIEPSAKRLFLVRHGEVINPGGDRAVYYGAMDVPLSALGEEEAKAAALYLKGSGMDIELVVSSPLSRAVFGAKQVLELQSTLAAEDMVIMDGFKELDRGSWCGKTKDEIGFEMMAQFDACDESVTPEGGESYPFLKERVLRARDAVLEKLSTGRSAVIVSHLQVTRCILSEALGIPIEEMSSLKVATASVTCIDYDAKSRTQIVHFQSFKPSVGLQTSEDGAN